MEENFRSFIFSGLSEQERASISKISATARAHSETVDDHSKQAACIKQHTINTFKQKYMVCLILHLMNRPF